MRYCHFPRNLGLGSTSFLGIVYCRFFRVSYLDARKNLKRDVRAVQLAIGDFVLRNGLNQQALGFVQLVAGWAHARLLVDHITIFGPGKMNISCRDDEKLPRRIGGCIVFTYVCA